MSDQEQDSVHQPFHREGDALVFDAPPDPIETARQRREDEQHEFARSQVQTNKRLAWFTGALVIATFCTIGVGIWQGTISQTAANAARDAVATAEQARKDAKVASEASEKNSKDTLQATIDNFRKDERPYLAESRDGVTKPVIYANPFTPGKVQIAWTWEVENFGKTPVRNFTMYQYMKLRDGEFIPSYGSHGQTNGKAHDSGGSQPPGVKSKDSIFSRPMTVQEANAILASNEGVSIRVRVVYQDLEGDTYETSLCHQVDGRGGMVANCKRYNYIR